MTADLTENEICQRPSSAADFSDAWNLGGGNVGRHHSKRDSMGGRHVDANEECANKHACHQTRGINTHTFCMLFHSPGLFVTLMLAWLRQPAGRSADT